jgi:hypothetical protein
MHGETVKHRIYVSNSTAKETVRRMRHKVTLCVNDLIIYFDTNLNINTINSEESVRMTNSATKISLAREKISCYTFDERKAKDNYFPV